MRWKPYLLFLVLLLAVGLSAVRTTAASEPAPDRAALLAQANSAFKEANETFATDPAAARELYRKALLRFERLAADGVANGRLFYNLGNVHFRLGDLGRAIVNYRRAERFMPEDENLRRNLAYALSLRADRIEPQETAQVLRILFFWHYDLPERVRAALFGVCYLMFWLCAGLLLLPRTRPAARWGLSVSSLCGLLLLGSLLVGGAGPGKARGVVVAETVARRGDGRSYAPAFDGPLHGGTEFRLIEDRGEWLQVELIDGSRAWLERQAAELVTTGNGAAAPAPGSPS